MPRKSAAGMKLVVGLGNPGEPYRGTRHNAGFEVLDTLAERHGIQLKRSWRFAADLGIVTSSSGKTVLARPRSYMNRSGGVVHGLCRRYRVGDELVVLVDDTDLPCGRIRVRRTGRAGGHNGLRSIEAMLGHRDFIRVRIGVGPRPPGEELVEYVLGVFTPDQREKIDRAVEQAAEAVDCILERGVDAAMTAFNRT